MILRRMKTSPARAIRTATMMGMVYLVVTSTATVMVCLGASPNREEPWYWNVTWDVDVSTVTPADALRVTRTVWFESGPRDADETVTVRPLSWAPEITVRPVGMVKVYVASVTATLAGFVKVTDIVNWWFSSGAEGEVTNVTVTGL